MIATFTLVGCEKGGEAAAAEEEKPAEEEEVTATAEEEEEMPAETITFWAMPNAPAEPHLAWIEDAAADFKKETNITIEFEEVGWGDAWTKISTACITPICDVSQVGTTWNPQLGATYGLLDLDIAEFGGEDAFLAANLESCTLGDKYYGVPWFAETRRLFINTDMFEEAGAATPRPSGRRHGRAARRSSSG